MQVSNDGMVFVPAGSFSKGITIETAVALARKYDVHMSYFGLLYPRGEVYVEGFYIDRYPVTNRQYQVFMTATGREPPSTWKGIEYPSGQDDYPVTGVTYWDAEAYCAWAGKRLPTEDEWEKAARGTDGRLFPWGNEWISGACRMDEARRPGDQFGHSPVGRYPYDISPYGVMDMAGNVEEWVSTEMRDNKGLGLTKGGSFVHSQPYNFLCAKNCVHSNINGRPLGYIGIRCVRGGADKPAPANQSMPVQHVKPNSSGELPQIEMDRYRNEAIRFSPHVEGNIKEFLRWGSLNVLSIKVPFFPEDQFMLWVLEGLAHPPKDCFIEFNAEKTLAIYRWEKTGQLVAESRFRANMDCVDALNRVRNIGTKSQTVMSANNCFNLLGAASFRDHEGCRTLILTDRGFRRVDQLHRTIRSGTCYEHLPTDFTTPLMAVVSRNGEWIVSQASDKAMAMWNNLAYGCVHSPWFQATLEPGAESVIRQKMYFLRGTPEDLLERWQRDFHKS